MNTVRRPLASFVLAALILSLASSDGQIVPAAEPAVVSVSRGRKMASRGSFGPAEKDLWRVSSSGEQGESFGPQKIAFGPREMMLDAGESPTIVRGGRTSQMAETRVRRMERMKIRLKSVISMFFGFSRGEKYALAPAKDNQVLAFIDGKISWSFMTPSGALADFVHEPGRGRKPSSDNESRSKGGQPVQATAAATDTSISETSADARYVNVSGDTMDGALTIASNGLGLVISGTASGNALHAERLLTVSGSSIFDGNVRFNSTVTIGGVSYTFPGSDGAASGKVLKTNAAGQLSWSDDDNSGGGGGLSQTGADLRYVNVSGDTMTGALSINLSSGYLGLKILQTASGNILHAEKSLSSSGTLTVSGIARFKSNVNVVGTISGSALQIMNGTSYVLGSLGIGTTTPRAKLEVLGSFSGARLYAASAFSGAGLATCSGAGQKLLWNSTTQQFSCGTDSNIAVSSGNTLAIGDTRYLRTSGGTMTGALTINLSSGSLGLRILQTASGNILHAEKDLTSSGALTVSGVARFKNNLNVVGTISGGALQIMNGTSYVLGSLGIGTTSPKAKLEVLGSFSGSRLYAASAFSGAGLSSCSAAGEKLLWNSTTQRFSCSTDLNGVFGSASVLTISDARYLRTSGGTMTGALAIRVSNAINSTIGLSVINTASGAILHAEKTLTSSGGLVFEGAASGSSLYVATSLRGAGLSDCSNTANSKLLWDATSGRFLCAQDQTGSVLTISSADERYVNQSGDTMTGALRINLSSGFLGLRIIQTASGNILHAASDLTSSGTLTVNSTARFKNNVNVVGTISGGGLNIMNGTSYVLGSLGIGTTSPKAKLEVLGSFSGARLYAASAFSGAGLTTCAGAGQKLLWNSTTQQFSCSTETVIETFGSGNVLAIGDARDLRTSGGTMTGALSINLSSGSLGLKILQTASGNILHAEKSLSSSGTLTVSGVARFKNNLNVVGTLSGSALQIMNGTSYVLGSLGIGTTSPKAKLEVLGSFSGARLYAASAFSGAGLSSCSAAGEKLLWNSTTQRFSCSTDLSGVFGSASVLTISDARYLRTSGGTMTGALTIRVTSAINSTIGLSVINTVSGAILHAEKTLTSSGGLVFEGAASGSSLYVANSITGVGLSDCDNAANSKLLWDSSSGRFSCAQDQTGSVLTVASADGRYVNTSGDTMTGALTVNLSSGHLGIKILQTASGNILHAEKSLSSSGTLTVSGIARFKSNLNVVGTISGGALQIMNGTSYVLGSLGIGTTTPRAKLEVLGSFSGARLYAASAFSGAGLSSCSGAGQKLFWNSTTQQFLCSTDQTSENFGSGNVIAAADPRYVNIGGDTMTGALTIDLSSGYLGLRILQTASGNILHAEKTFTSSGTIVAKNNVLSEQGAFVTRYGLQFLSGSSLAERSGFHQYVNFGEGIGTDASVRITTRGNLQNIGSIQAGETLLTAGGTFATRVNYRTGTLPTSVAIDDLNDDGKRDMVTVNSGGNSVSVFLNTGTGSYATRVNYTTGSSPRSVAIGDLTGDGKPDLAVANQNGATVSVFRNLGNGTFAAKADSTAGTNPYALSIADFNSDGRADLAVVNNGRDTFSILLNTGNAVFAPKADYSTASLPSSIAPSDLNGDGKQDILVTSVATDTVALFFGLGDGTFSSGVSYVTGSAPYSVAVGDLNSDSKPDFVVANFSSDSVSVFLNTGTGSFASKVDYAAASAPHSVAIGDITGDGKPDLAVASSNDDSVSIFTNLGSGTFAAKSDLSTGAVSHSVAIGDLNNDGKADLAVANNSAATVSVLLALPRTILFASVSTGGVIGIGLSTPGAKLSVSGAMIISARGNLLNARTDSGITLEVAGTISGSALKVLNDVTVSGSTLALGGMTSQRTISGNNLAVSHGATISGTLLVKTSITSKGSLSGATIGGFGLGSCSSATQKILYNFTTGKFECGTDNVNPVFGTGNYLNVTNAPYVNVAGDTMTGALTINLSSGFIGLNAVQTFSGNILHAEKDMTSSGTLTVSGIARFKSNLNVVGTLSGGALSIMNGTSYALGSLRVGTTSPKAKLDVYGTISGTTLTVSGNGSFSGTLMMVGNTTARGTLSGTHLTVSRSASISGALLVKTSITSKGSVSGVTIAGFALGSCNGSTQKLLYNNSLQTFACGRDIGLIDNTNSGNVLKIGDARYVKKQGDTMTGALVIDLTSGYLGLRVLQMASGSILHAEKSLTSSGLLMVTQNRRQGSGALVVEQRANSTGVYITSRSQFNPVLALDSSTGSFKAPHILFGTNGFFDVALWRTAGSLNLSGHLLPHLTNKFDLGSSTKRWRSLYLSGGTMYIGTAGNDASINYNTSASRFGIDSNNDGTNDLSILSTGLAGIGTSAPKAKLDVSGTISGTTLTITRNGSFSGSLTVVGGITSRGSISGSTINGFSLGSCSDATASKLLYNYSTQKFECGSDYDPTGGLTSASLFAIGDPRYVKKQGDTMTGTLKNRGYLLASGTTLSEMSGWNEYLNVIHSGVGTNSVTRLTKDGDLKNIGTIQSGEAHMRRGGIFAPKVNFAAEGEMISPVIRDFNGDGKLDIAVDDVQGGVVSVYINTGTGSYATEVEYTTGGNPIGLASEDFNGDGKPDLAVGGGAGLLTILINNGNGTFRTKVDYSTGNARSVASADFDGDGDMDVAVARDGVAAVVVFLNNGNGTFATATSYSVATAPYGVDTGDFNGDGKMDIAAAGPSSSNISILMNNGNGTFQTKVDYAASSGNFAIAVDDLNADGKDDVVAASNSAGAVSVFINNGDGTLGSAIAYGSLFQPNSVKLGDLNGDGKNDIAAISTGASSFVAVLMNNGNGTFATQSSYSIGTVPEGVAIGDLNNDGKNDLVTSHGFLGSKNISVLLNISKTILFASSGTGGAVGIGTSTPGSILSVSGAMIISRDGNLANARADSGISLEVVGTSSGRVLYAKDMLHSSGSVIVEGTISGALLRLGNLGVCNTTVKKLTYNTTTNNIECASDEYGQEFGTGQVLTIGDANALRKSGGTMSGALVINLSSGFLGLKIVNTASGNIIHAEKDLTSSGTLTAVGVARFKNNLNAVGTISGGALRIMNGTSYILGSLGIGNTSPKAKLDVSGTISGSTLTISGNGSFSGSVIVRSSISGSSIYSFGLGDCNNASTSKLVYNNTTGKFVCATDRGATAYDYQQAAGTFVNQSGDTMTGALTIGLSSGFLGLKVIQTASGNILHAEKDLTSSGTLTAVGVARLKSNLNAVGTISGGALQIMNGTSYIRGSFGIGSSGTPKAKLDVQGTISGTTLTISKNGSFSGSLIVKNNLSGSSFYGAGLGACTGTTTQKLLYNNTTGKFSCGSDDPGTSGLTYGSMAGTFVNQSGDTMTGALTINLSSGYLGLKVLQTASGNILHAEKNLTSSGTIIAVGDILTRNGTAKTKGYVLFSGATLSELSGFNEYVNIIHSGLGTNSVTRLTNQGDLKNIGTIQAGESHFRRGGIFASKVDYTTGTGPQSVSIGDLNGDGKMDMATANTTNGTVSVFIGTGSGLFVAKVDYATGSSPHSVAIGDLNGDGKPDLAVANNSSSTVSIFLNNGNGTFAAKVDYTTGVNPYSVAISDLNGDGKADLATANQTADSVSVFLNNGNGTFATKVDYTTNSNPKSVQIGELNGDGKADIVIIGNASTSVSVYLNNGNGTFAAKVDYTTGSSPISVAIGDLNGDGKADLGVVNAGSSSVSIFLNNGNGTFATKVDYTTGSSPHFVAIGDLNGDGKADLGVVNAGSSSVSIFLNNGNGTFVAKVDYTTGTTPNSVAIGDLNGDAKLDLAVANQGGSSVSVFLNISKTILYASSGTGGAVGIGTPTPGSALSVSGAMLVNRGGNILNTSADSSVALEVIGTMSGTNLTVSRSASISGALLVKTSITSKGSVSGATINGFNLGSCSASSKKLLYNNSTQKFECGTDTQVSVNFGTGNVLTLVDARYLKIQGGTMTGALTINLGSGHLGLKVLQTSSGNILHAEKSLSSSGTIIAVGDILSRNGTAKTKGYVLFSGATLSEMSGFNEYVNLIRSGLGTNSVTRLTNQGDLKNISTIQSGEAHFRRGGIFAPKVDYAAVNNTTSVAIADLNGDGKADLIAGNYTSGYISVFLSNGNGTFAAKVDYITSGGVFTIATGDLNGDGNQDIVVNTGSSYVGVLINHGNGTFPAAVFYPTSSGTFSVAIGDLNGDGKSDIAAACQTDGVVRVLLNRGNGTFVSSVAYAAGTNARFVAIGDLNGDSKSDLAVANDSNTSVLLNNGNGTFQTKVDYTAGTNPYSVAIGDLNGDGKGDLAVANYNSVNVSVLTNNGNGTFASSVNYTTGSTPRSVAIGDLNGDGKGDLAVANEGSDTVSTFLNNGNGTFASKVDYTAGDAPYSIAIGDLDGDGKADLAAANYTSVSASVFLNISKTILYASAGTGGAVGIGTSTPGSALAVSGAVIINRGGNIVNTSADAGITLEVVGTASGRVFHAQDVLRSSGSLIVEGNMSGATLQGAGLASCNTATTKKLLYNNSSKKFECGSDTQLTFGSGNVFTIGDSRYLRTSGGTMTGALTINLTSGYLGLKIIQTASGNILHAEKSLTSSGTIVGALDIIAKGSVKSDAYVLSSGSTLAEMSGWNEYANLVHSGLGTNSVVRLTNQGDLKNIGTIQAGEAHMRRGGIFAPKVDYATGTEPYSVAIGDLNGDAKNDLIVSNNVSNTVSVFIGTGAGLFVSKVDYVTGTGPWPVAIGDLNGDGKPDFAVGNYGGDSLSVFVNNGDGTFASKVDYTTANDPRALAISDVNGDGKGDLVVGNAGAASVSIFLNNGNGTFAAKVDYAASSFVYGVAVGDVNGDGKADIATVTASNTVGVLLNTGKGIFAANVDYASGTSPYAVAMGDLNGDGQADIIATSGGSHLASVLMNNGNGTFATKVDYSTGNQPFFVSIADLNGDGKQDFAVANSSSASVSVFLNKGNGTFPAKVDYTSGTFPASVAIGELNGDGKADLAVANKTSGTVSIFLNTSKTILYASAGTGGAVGIGTSTPGSALSVSGAMIINRGGNLANAKTDTGITLEVVGTASGRILHAHDLLRSSGALAIENDSYFGSGITIKTSHSNEGASEFTIITDYSTSNNKVFRVSASGAVYSDATYNSNGADYAEWFRDGSEERQKGQKGLQPGEVVCIDILHENTVKRCERSGDPNVMGIVSSNPAFVGNVISGADGIMPPGYALIGLIGQVPAKPSLENGPIHEGDSVTSASEPGFVRKASAGESTVGVALEGYDGIDHDGVGLINILISRRNQSLTVETLEEKVLQQIAAMNLADRIAQLTEKASRALGIEERVSEILSSQVEELDFTSEINAMIDERILEQDSASGEILTFGSHLTDAELSALTDAISRQLELQSATGSLDQNYELLVPRSLGEGGGITNYEFQLSELQDRFLILKAQISKLTASFGSGETLHASALSLSSGATLRSGSGQAALTLNGSMIVNDHFRILRSSTGTTLSGSELSVLSVSGSEIAIGSLFATGSLKVIGDITVTGLATFLGDVHIKGDLVLSSRQAGFAVIPASGTAVTVTFSGAMVSKPIVIATPSALVRFGISKVSATGFTILLKDPAQEEVRFLFVAYGSDNPPTTLGTIDAPVSLASTGAPSLIPVLQTLSGTLSSIDEMISETDSGASIQSESEESGIPMSASGSESLPSVSLEESVSLDSTSEVNTGSAVETGSGVVEE